MITEYVTSRMSVLLPSVQYGNVTLEAEARVTFGNGEDLKEAQEYANNIVRKQIELQKDEVDKYTREFFKVSV